MVEINNLTRFKFDKKRLEGLSEKVLEKEKKQKIALAITFVGEKEIRKLNKKYRKTDAPTDVLSFTYEKSGEILICPPVVKKNAKSFGETFQKELTRVFIHGILHILGYNHEKGGAEAAVMQKKGEYYLSKY
jgi:probable rRNA maturation factor